METPEPSDPNDINQVMQQMLAQNAVAAEAVVTGAQAGLDEVLAQYQKAQDDLNAVKQNADSLAAEFYTKYRTWVEGYTRENIVTDLTRRLLRAGESLNEIVGLLEVPEQLVETTARELGLTAFKNVLTDLNSKTMTDTQYAWLSYESHGRTGAVILHLGKKTCKFWHDIGSGNALIVLDVPTEADWETQTGIPLAQRRAVLEFIGSQLAMSEVYDCSYQIKADTIVISR